MDHKEWAAPLIHFSSGIRPRNSRWGRTRELMGLTSYSREFLREERLPALLRMHSLDLGREGSSLSGQVMLKRAVRVRCGTASWFSKLGSS